MDSITPNNVPKAEPPTCEPATPAHGKSALTANNLPPSGQAGLTPADRENMLSLFPEHTDRILAASQKDAAPIDQAHTVV